MGSENHDNDSLPDTECTLTHDFEAAKQEVTGPQLDSIPDGGYGWLVVFACFLLNFNTWGANLGFAIYLSYYLNHGTFHGADKYDYALIGGITFGVGLVFAPGINYIQGKIGMRSTIILGNCFQFAALMMASFATALWQLYLTQGVLQAFGLAFLTIPAMAVLPQWFKKKRTFALAILAAGLGCGGIVYNLGMQRVMEVRLVHWALRAQLIMCFGMCWVSIALVRTRMKVSFTLFDAQVLRSVGFWLLVLYLVFCMFGYVVVLYDMANFTTSLGYSAYQGSIASAMVQVGSVLGRPLVGRLSDRFGVISVTAAAYSLCAVFVFAMWIPAKNFATIVAFCVIIGSMMGSVFATMPPILSKLFGLQRVGVALSMSWVFLGLAGIASPVIGLSLKEGNAGYVGLGQYLHCSIFSGVSFALCAAMLLIMRGYVIYRHDAADVDADMGHMHIAVPPWAPFTHYMKRRSHI